MNQPLSRRAGFLFLVTVWICWGYNYPATKLMPQSIDVWAGRALIMGVAGVCILILARSMGQGIAFHWTNSAT